jgi:hypothetical protein
MGFEDRIFRNIDKSREKRQELSPSMERAHRKALTMLHDPEYSIQEESFVSVYGKERVNEDKALTTRLRSKFDMQQTPFERISKQMADTLEAILLDESEMSDWFGENATTVKTSDYDDFVNKVDMLTEWHTPGEGMRMLALAVDVTFGTESIRKKITQIRDEIDSGSLGSIKYFKDVRGDFMGMRNNVPRIVLGVSQPMVEELANLWVNGEKEKLGVHPIQRVFAIQMRAQLQAMEKYAASKGKHGIVSAYQNALGAVIPIEESKRKFPLGALIEDPVAREISRQTATHFE